MINKEKIKGLTEKIGKALFKYSRIFMYTDIEDHRFKMRDYIKITACGKLNYILKFPIYVPKKFKMAAFNDMQAKYTEISGNKEAHETADRIAKYNIMIRKVNILKICGYVLSMHTNSQKHKEKLEAQKEEVMEFLKKSNIKGDDILDKILGEINNIELRAEAIELSLKIDKAEEGNKRVSEAHYSRIFMLLTKMGYPSNRDMSVIDYINALKLYREEVDSNKKQIEKMKRHGRN